MGRDSNKAHLKIKKGTLIAVVETKTSSQTSLNWQITVDIELYQWMHLQFTWSRKLGLFLYINGTENHQALPIFAERPEVESDSKLYVGCKTGNTAFGTLLIDKLTFMDAFRNQSEADNVFKKELETITEISGFVYEMTQTNFDAKYFMTSTVCSETRTFLSENGQHMMWFYDATNWVLTSPAKACSATLLDDETLLRGRATVTSSSVTYPTDVLSWTVYTDGKWKDTASVISKSG